MLQRLQQKWRVNGLQLILILCTFAIGGSLTGYAGKKLMNLFGIEQRAVWIILYILIITIIWPLAVLLVSIPFGQYRFFTSYLKKMGHRMGLIRQAEPMNREKDPADLSHPPGDVIRFALFASGAGSNAQKIIEYFRSKRISPALVVCNKPGAGVLSIAANAQIPSLLIEKEQFFRGNGYVDELKQQQIDFIVLAGFLWKIPQTLIEAFPNRIINIHPALLPRYGGKGMYGNYVHEAVIAAGDQESGITIHYVDGHYDNGDIIFQATCPVLPTDTSSSLASRIHELEHAHYPRVIEEVLTKEWPRSQT